MIIKTFSCCRLAKEFFWGIQVFAESEGRCLLLSVFSCAYGFLLGSYQSAYICFVSNILAENGTNY